MYRRRLLEAEKFSSLGLLTAGIAHEINNPNTFVKGNLELLLKFADLIEPLLNERCEAEGPDQEKLGRWFGIPSARRFAPQSWAQLDFDAFSLASLREKASKFHSMRSKALSAAATTGSGRANQRLLGTRPYEPGEGGAQCCAGTIGEVRRRQLAAGKSRRCRGPRAPNSFDSADVAGRERNGYN